MAKLNFSVRENDEGQLGLFVELDTNGLPKDDIRVKWAQLGLRYANELVESGAAPLKANTFGEDKGAVISFESHEDFEDDGDFDDGPYCEDCDEHMDFCDCVDDDFDCDDELDDEPQFDLSQGFEIIEDDAETIADNAPQNTSETVEQSQPVATEDGLRIGFRLSTDNSYRAIGGMAKPSVALSTLVYRALLNARAKVALED